MVIICSLTLQVVNMRTIVKCKSTNRCPETAVFKKAIYCAYEETEDEDVFTVKCFDSKAKEVYSYFYSSIEIL